MSGNWSSIADPSSHVAEGIYRSLCYIYRSVADLLAKSYLTANKCHECIFLSFDFLALGLGDVPNP